MTRFFYDAIQTIIGHIFKQCGIEPMWDSFLSDQEDSPLGRIFSNYENETLMWVCKYLHESGREVGGLGFDRLWVRRKADGSVENLVHHLPYIEALVKRMTNIPIKLKVTLLDAAKIRAELTPPDIADEEKVAPE